MTTRIHPTALLPALAAAACAAVAPAAASAKDAAVTIGAPFARHAGERAPFDAAGVPAVRRGKPIPAGYALVGRKVTIDRGTAGSSGAVLLLRCPAGKTARTLGFTGANAPTYIGVHSYEGHKEVRVAVWSPPRDPVSTGVSYVVCR